MKPIPWWTVAAASIAAVLLIGGFVVATALQPTSYNPVRGTISELAWQGANDSWVMTSALAGVGLCYLVVGLGLPPAGGGGRVLLASMATLLIAVFRQPRHGYSVEHELAVIAAAVSCCTWPVVASQRQHPIPLFRRSPSFVAVGVMLALVAWYAAESHGAFLGLAERAAAAAPALWLLAVAVSARHVRAQRTDRDSPLEPQVVQPARTGPAS